MLCGTSRYEQFLILMSQTPQFFTLVLVQSSTTLTSGKIKTGSQGILKFTYPENTDEVISINVDFLVEEIDICNNHFEDDCDFGELVVALVDFLSLSLGLITTTC